MTTYVDSSALIKRYVAEPESSVAERLLLDAIALLVVDEAVCRSAARIGVLEG